MKRTARQILDTTRLSDGRLAVVHSRDSRPGAPASLSTSDNLRTRGLVLPAMRTYSQKWNLAHTGEEGDGEMADDRPGETGNPTPAEPTPEEPTTPHPPLPPKPDQSGPRPTTPTGVPSKDSQADQAQQGDWLTSAQGARLVDTDHSLKAGPADRSCFRITTCARRSLTSTTRGFPNESSMPGARRRMERSSPMAPRAT